MERSVLHAGQGQPPLALVASGLWQTSTSSLSSQCRVIIHDRRNCGKSDMVIGGELSEQHIWAEEMAALLKYLDAAPAYVAGGSAG